MITVPQMTRLLPLAISWAEEQERLILETGIPLNEDQQIDAYLAGVQEIQKVRLMEVEDIPYPHLMELGQAAQQFHLITGNTMGVTFRYGIYVRRAYLNNRRLILHLLTYTMQYEKMGGFYPFLTQYFNECIASGYPNGSLEQEAKQLSKEIWTKH